MKDCPNPTLYLKGYDCPAQSKQRAYPKEQLPLSPKAKRRRLVDNKQAPDQVKAPNENSYIKKEPTETVSGIDNVEGISESVSQCEDVRTEELPEMCEPTQCRNLFVTQATCTKNCFKYTGITRPKLDLVFDLVNEKAQSLWYWRGSVNTPPSQHEKKKKEPPRILTIWEELILTLVRTRKGFDVHFLADTSSTVVAL